MQASVARLVEIEIDRPGAAEARQEIVGVAEIERGREHLPEHRQVRVADFRRDHAAAPRDRVHLGGRAEIGVRVANGLGGARGVRLAPQHLGDASVLHLDQRDDDLEASRRIGCEDTCRGVEIVGHRAAAGAGCEVTVVGVPLRNEVAYGGRYRVDALVHGEQRSGLE